MPCWTLYNIIAEGRVKLGNRSSSEKWLSNAFCAWISDTHDVTGSFFDPYYEELRASPPSFEKHALCVWKGRPQCKGYSWVLYGQLSVTELHVREYILPVFRLGVFSWSNLHSYCMKMCVGDPFLRKMYALLFGCFQKGAFSFNYYLNAFIELFHDWSSTEAYDAYATNSRQARYCLDEKEKQEKRYSALSVSGCWWDCMRHSWFWSRFEKLCNADERRHTRAI